MYLEEICLSTTEPDPEADRAPDPVEKIAGLEQANALRRSLSVFALLNTLHLSVKTQGFMKAASEYTVDLGILDPRPKRSLKICWSYLLLFLVFGGGAAFFSLGEAAATSPMQLPVVLGSCAVLSLVLAVYGSHDRLVFYSRHGRAPLVILFNRSPDRARFDQFVDILVSDIKRAGNRDLADNEILIEELKEHRRLMETGVISPKRYDIIKQRILSRHS